MEPIGKVIFKLLDELYKKNKIYKSVINYVHNLIKKADNKLFLIHNILYQFSEIPNPSKIKNITHAKNELRKYSKRLKKSNYT